MAAPVGFGVDPLTLHERFSARDAGAAFPIEYWDARRSEVATNCQLLATNDYQDDIFVVRLPTGWSDQPDGSAGERVTSGQRLRLPGGEQMPIPDGVPGQPGPGEDGRPMPHSQDHWMNATLQRTPTQVRRAEVDVPQYLAELEDSVQRCLSAAQTASRLQAEALQALDTDEAILTGSLPVGDSGRFLADIDLPGCQASIERMRSVLCQCVQADVVEVDELLARSGWARYITKRGEQETQPEPAGAEH